jgi:peptidoglycan/LPS O-acetylase OafA/YrhL
VGIPARRPQLDALTSLRFFAALHVVLYHGQAYLLPSLRGQPWLGNVITTGPNSVSLFFVLSGFILAYTYLGPPEEGRLRRGSFWAARFARVYPVYLFGLLVAAPLAIAGFLRGGAGPGRLALAAGTVLALVQSWTPHFALAWNGPAWSLSVEAFFYAVFPFVAPALWPLKRRGLLLSLLAFWALAQLAPALYALAPDGGWLGGWKPPADFWTAAMNDIPYRRWDNPWYAAIQYNPLARLPEFLFGVALGRLYLLHAAAAPRPAGWSLAAAGAAAALLAALAGSPDRLRHSLFFHNGLLTPLYGLLIFGLARGRTGALSGALSRRPLVVLGEASYALYILHVPLLMIVEAAGRHLTAGTVPALPFFAAYAVGTVLISVAVLRAVEEPARRALRRWFARFD